MNKLMNIRVLHVLLAIMLFFMLAGCSKSTNKATPTAQPPYLHYVPSEGFNVHLDFYYPSKWVLSEEKFQNTDTIFVGLGDPRLLTIPTRAPNESHGKPSDFGRISILIKSTISNQTLDILVEPHKNGYEGTSWISSLAEYKTIVDGYDALAFEYQVEPIDSNGFTSMMFERNIFFIIENQLYQLTFLVAEKERGGEFEQGYEYFFQSLEIVP